MRARGEFRSSGLRAADLYPASSLSEEGEGSSQGWRSQLRPFRRRGRKQASPRALCRCWSWWPESVVFGVRRQVLRRVPPLSRPNIGNNHEAIFQTCRVEEAEKTETIENQSQSWKGTEVDAAALGPGRPLLAPRGRRNVGRGGEVFLEFAASGASRNLGGERRTHAWRDLRFLPQRHAGDPRRQPRDRIYDQSARRRGGQGPSDHHG